MRLYVLSGSQEKKRKKNLFNLIVIIFVTETQFVYCAVRAEPRKNNVRYIKILPRIDTHSMNQVLIPPAFTG